MCRSRRLASEVRDLIEVPRSVVCPEERGTHRARRRVERRTAATILFPFDHRHEVAWKAKRGQRAREPQIVGVHSNQVRQRLVRHRHLRTDTFGSEPPQATPSYAYRHCRRIDRHDLTIEPGIDRPVSHIACGTAGLVLLVDTCRMLADLRLHDVMFCGGEVMLAGSLAMPDRPTPSPGVVMVGGSGPSDQNNDTLFP